MHPIFQISSVGLRQDVQRATVLNLAARGARLLIDFLALTILARLLTPDDFGVFAMVMPFIAVIMILGDLGLASAILQQRDLTERQASAVLWINVLLGLALGGAFLAASPLLGALYGDPRVTPVAAVLGLLFVFSGLTAVQRALLRRALRFDLLLRAQLVAAVFSLVAGVTLGFAGAGYWALAVRALADSLVYGLVVWVSSRWLPTHPVWDDTTRSMLRYGRFFVGFSLLNATGRQADNVLIGWRYGSVELGPYALAYRLFFLPMQLLTMPLGQVFIPAFSRLRDEPQRIRTWYLATLRLLTMCAFPPLFSLVICAPDLVRVVVGPQWDNAATILQMLAPASALQVGFTTIGWLLQSQGRADRSFYLATVMAPIYILSFIVGLPWGAAGVAAAYTVANVALFIPGFMYGIRDTAITLPDIARSMLPSAILVLIAVPVVFAAQVLVSAEWSPLPRLMLAAALIAIVMMAGASVVYGPSTIFAAGRSGAALVRPSSGEIR
jgi:O-antigen/teichoic acid export membrane protein